MTTELYCVMYNVLDEYNEYISTDYLEQEVSCRREAIDKTIDETDMIYNHTDFTIELTNVYTPEQLDYILCEAIYLINKHKPLCPKSWN